MQTPDHASDAHSQLVETLRTPTGRRYMSLFLESVARSDGAVPVASPTGAVTDVNPTPEQAADYITDTVAAAPTWLVTADMCGVIEQTAPALPDDYRLQPHHLTSRSGIAWLAEPLTTVDIWGDTNRYHAIAWRDMGGWLWWGAITDRTDPDDTVSRAIRESDSDGLLSSLRWGFGHVASQAYDRPWADGIDASAAAAVEQRARVGHPADGRAPMSAAHVAENHRRMRGYILTMWAMAQQKMASVEPGRVSRGATKRAARTGALPDPGSVRVVDLRQRHHVAERTDGGGEPGRWSHRWVVRGHWHTYHTRVGKVLRWVEPFVKGPEDKPLVVRNDVMLVRTGDEQ